MVMSAHPHYDQPPLTNLKMTTKYCNQDVMYQCQMDTFVLIMAATPCVKVHMFGIFHLYLVHHRNLVRNRRVNSVFITLTIPH